MLLSAPSSYMSMGDPRVFDSRETVVEDLSSGKTTRPRTSRTVHGCRPARAAAVAKHYIGFVQFIDPAHFPNVDVYAEKGPASTPWSGSGYTTSRPASCWTPRRRSSPATATSTRKTSRTTLSRRGARCACWHFSLTDNPGVDHFSLPSDPSLLARLIADANAPRSHCS